MKKAGIVIIALLTLSLAVPMAMAVKPDYATIKDGTIYYGRVGTPNTDVIPIGYDQWGYNYQAHIYNGYYDNYQRPDVLATEGDWLVMKWSDEWLSNKDRNFDGKLDRGTEAPWTSSASEGAWCTNHMMGTYPDGTKWTYFVKIVCAPDDAVNVDGVWYAADGDEIGPVIWGAYAIIQEFENNLGHEVVYMSPGPVGLGYIK